jgi:RNA polymerase sigma-70 factor (ECF subfamily)
MDIPKVEIRKSLLPLSWLYGTVVSFRNWLFNKNILKQRSFSIPIICVGNITAGGTGKTPHIEYLIRLLSPKFKVAVLSRGYKRKSKGFLIVDTNSNVRNVGDEPLQIKKKFPDTLVVVDKNRDAQRALYERFAPVMMSVCIRYCGDEDIARDLLHDGFIRVFTQIGSFTGKGSFEGWLRRIFVNLALENYRKEKRKNLFLEEYGQMYINESEDQADDLLDIEDIPREVVFEMIRNLPTGYRTVFNLYIFEDMSHKEIAEELGINEAASRSQFFRAKTLLKKKIEAMLEKNHQRKVQ